MQLDYCSNRILTTCTFHIAPYNQLTLFETFLSHSLLAIECTNMNFIYIPFKQEVLVYHRKDFGQSNLIWYAYQFAMLVIVQA